MNAIRILSTKYDGSLHWDYEPRLLEEGPWGWLTFHDREQPTHSHKGTWLNKHPFLRWHFRDRWWDALLVFDDAGRWLEWYCNIVTPPQLVDGVLRYHDLDLDVVWHRERGLQVVDAEEFEENAVKMGYPSALIQSAWENAQGVRRMIQAREWRFGEDPDTFDLMQELAQWNGHTIS